MLRSITHKLRRGKHGVDNYARRKVSGTTLHVHGKRESKIFRTRREANAWAAARETELLEDSGKTPAERITLHVLLRRYVDEVSPTKHGATKEIIRLNAMIRMLPDIPLSEVSAETIKHYRDERLAIVKPNSALRELGSLSAVFEHAIHEWRLTESNPVRKTRKPPRGEHRRKIYSKTAIRLLLAEMGYSPRDRVSSVASAVAACFLVALRTGMRAGELCGLTWANVSRDACHVSGKTPAASRDIPLTIKTRRLIDRMRGFDPRFVFGIKAASLDAMFRKYRKRAGIDDMTFHDSRHTAATWLVRDSQLNAFELCRIMGWTDPKMAMIYFQPSVADLAKRMTGRK